MSRIGQLKNEATDRPTRLQIALWGMLLVVGLLLFVRGFRTEQIGLYPDESHYIILARSLVHSSSYGLINYPDQPHLSNYPFGYPLLLAPFVLLWPDNLDVMKTLSLIATGLNITLLFWGWHWLTRRFSYWWGIAIAGLYALAPLTVNHSWMIMSEPIFMTFSLAAMILTEQAAREKQGRWWSLWMSVALTLVIFTRTIGVILLPCILVYLIIARGRRFSHELALAFGGIIFWTALVVLGTSVHVPDLLPIRYVNQAVASTAPNNPPPINATPNNASRDPSPAENKWLSRLSFFITQNMATDIREAVIPVGGGEKEQQLLAHTGVSGASLVIGLIICGFLLLGFMRWVKAEGLSIFLLFMVPYFASLVVWVWKGTRFLYPIEPPLFLCLLLAVQTIGLWGSSLSKRLARVANLQRAILPTFVAVLLVMSVYKSITIDDTRLHIGDLEARSNWLKANTKASDIVMTEHPETDYLYSGRKTVFYPDTTDDLQDKDVNEYLQKHNIQYILVAPHTWWQTSYIPAYSTDTNRLLPLLASLATRNRISLVYAEDRELIKIYKVVP